MLLASFTVIFSASKASFNIRQKYPDIDCQSFYENTGKNLINFAYEEWLLNEKRIEMDKKTEYAGFLKCFCDQQSELYQANPS